jgi:hypothetical protein
VSGCNGGERHSLYVRGEQRYCKRCGLRFGVPCEPEPANDTPAAVVREIVAAEIAEKHPTADIVNATFWATMFGHHLFEETLRLATTIATHEETT